MFREIIFILLWLLSFNTVVVDGASITFVVPSAASGGTASEGSVNIGATSIEMPLSTIIPESNTLQLPSLPPSLPAPTSGETILQRLHELLDPLFSQYQERASTTKPLQSIAEIPQKEDVRIFQEKTREYPLPSEESSLDLVQYHKRLKESSIGDTSHYRERVKGALHNIDTFDKYHTKVKEVL